jgi:hypothetical protein
MIFKAPRQSRPIPVAAWKPRHDLDGIVRHRLCDRFRLRHSFAAAVSLRILRRIHHRITRITVGRIVIIGTVVIIIFVLLPGRRLLEGLFQLLLPGIRVRRGHVGVRIETLAELVEELVRALVPVVVDQGLVHHLVECRGTVIEGPRCVRLSRDLPLRPPLPAVAVEVRIEPQHVAGRGDAGLHVVAAHVLAGVVDRLEVGFAEDVADRLVFQAFPFVEVGEDEPAEFDDFHVEGRGGAQPRAAFGPQFRGLEDGVVEDFRAKEFCEGHGMGSVSIISPLIIYLSSKV